jgi:hypothetical protein
MGKDSEEIACNVAMVPLTILWGCWLASSLGVPFLTAFYVRNLDEKEGLSTIGSGDIIWSTILGPFSIPVSLIHAGIRTAEYLRR